ncbi:hypothetical protein G7046_g1582 [Stylonectria norvegica]|nr:hypothetical protein G7046_g1582 [Stylonectria norvegica]
MRHYAIPILTLAGFLWLAFSSWNSERDHAMEDVDHEPQKSPTSAIGVALTTTYGALSVRYPDGTIHDIGRVEGSDEYIKMMGRLSSEAKRHPSPPYGSVTSMWKDRYRQLLRRMRELVGLPASSDVAILVEMLRPLFQMNPTGEKILTAVISYPPIVALYNEDIDDAANYLHVAAQIGPHIYEPREMLAAYAGHGLGLCSHPEDKSVCMAELRELPEVQVLHMDYTKKAMVFQFATVRAAQDVAKDNIKALVRFDMGSDQRHEDGFLQKLEIWLMTFLGGRCPPEKPEMLVIMTGNEVDVGDPDVKNAVRNALTASGFTSIEILCSKPEYIAARGVAELCWRGKLCYPEWPGDSKGL